MKIKRNVFSKTMAIFLVCLLAIGLLPNGFVLAASVPPLELDKTAVWIEDDVPTAEVTLSVRGEERAVESDIVVLLDRSYSMYTDWCINPDHYKEELIVAEAVYEVRVQGSGDWSTVTSWLTIRMTTHESGGNQPTLAGLSISGHETIYNGSPIAGYRSASGGEWAPGDWSAVENATGADFTARMNLRAFILSLIGDNQYIHDNYLYMENILTDSSLFSIEKPPINGLHGCQNPQMLGVKAAKDLANSVIDLNLQNGANNNIALLTFGPGRLLLSTNKYISLLAGFDATQSAWNSIPANLESQASNATRYAMALQAAKYYLATEGDYDLIDPATNLPYSPPLPYYDLSDNTSDAFDSLLETSSSALCEMLDNGILRSRTGDRVPYIVIFSSVVPLANQPALSNYERTGFAVNTKGIEVHGIGFAENSWIEQSENFERLTKGYKTDKTGSVQADVYPGHNSPPGSALYNDYKGSFSRILDGSEFTRAFEDLQRNLRGIGFYDATITDIIGAGFVLDQSRPIMPPNADRSYDSATNTITWYLENISDIVATLTYYVKAVPPDPPDLSLLDGQYVEDKGTQDPFMFPNESATIDYKDILENPYNDEFKDPRLPVVEIEYTVEYYLDDEAIPDDSVTIVGYATPLDPFIPFDDSLADKDKYLPEYFFDEDASDALPEKVGSADLVKLFKLYYRSVPPEGLQKTAISGSTLVQNGTISFDLSFDIPENVSRYSGVRICDDIPADLSYQSAAIKIGDNLAVSVTGLVDLSISGEASYSLTGTDFQDAAGKTVVFTIVFNVDTMPESGYIVNRGTLFYIPAGGGPEEPSGEDESIVIAVEKHANPKTFTNNGDIIDYTISFALPSELDKYEALRIEDIYPPTLSLVGTTGDLAIGTAAPVQVTLDTGTAGKVSYMLTDDDLWSAAGQTVSLTLKFAIQDWTSGSIVNTANLFFTPMDGVEEPGGSDDETVTPYKPEDPTTPTTPSPQNVVVNILAKKTIAGASGGTLSAGQFEFELLRNGQRVATAVNDKDGNIAFRVEVSEAGTYVYTMREIQKSGNETWIIDNTEHTVTVTVTSSEGDLVATVDKTPEFINTYSPGELILVLKKVLVDAAGEPIETGKQFVVNIYKLDEYMKPTGQPIEKVTLSANGDGIIVAGLQGVAQYVIWETHVDGYYTEGYSVVDGGGTETVYGPAVGLDISALSRNKSVLVTLTNKPGTGEPGGPGSPQPPVIKIGDTNINDPDVPLSPFISDHVAYIIGYPEGDVRPQRNITRAEVTTVFFRLLTDAIRTDNWVQTNQFPDVLQENWFNNAVSVMGKLGIIQGYPDGSFMPDGAITRAELATIAARFAREMYMIQIADRNFTDISGHWAESDIRYAAAIGWVNGYPDGTFMPNQPITRAEFMTLVNRMLERVPEKEEDLLKDDMIKWVDNADLDAWFYLAVQEATNSHIPEYKAGDFVPGLLFRFERWVEMTANRDWAQFEKSWSTANSGG